MPEIRITISKAQAAMLRAYYGKRSTEDAAAALFRDAIRRMNDIAAQPPRVRQTRVW